MQKLDVKGPGEARRVGPRPSAAAPRPRVGRQAVNLRPACAFCRLVGVERLPEYHWRQFRIRGTRRRVSNSASIAKAGKGGGGQVLKGEAEVSPEDLQRRPVARRVLQSLPPEDHV